MLNYYSVAIASGVIVSVTDLEKKRGCGEDIMSLRF